MREKLKRLALTLAGVGVLAGASKGSESAEGLHDRIRTRVLLAVSAEGENSESVRGALVRDPEFSRLLTEIRHRSLMKVKASDHAEDALQEALMKTWTGRPQIFLRPYQEVLRYLQTSTRHNLLTQLKKAAYHGRKVSFSEENAEATPSQAPDPSDEVTERDLFRALSSNIEDRDQPVYLALLNGAKSEREVARATGLSRHLVARATSRIAQELGELLAQDVESGFKRQITTTPDPEQEQRAAKSA